MDAAEQAKRRFVFSLDYRDKTEVLRTAAGSKKVSHQAISYIIEARAGELAGMIRREMETLGVNLDARPAVYVSGGGLLMMRGGLDFLREALNLPLKRDMPWTPRLSSPNYCSAFGALDFVLKANSAPEESMAKQQDDRLSRLLQKIKDFFMK
jgi:cell division ATPase FtsA